MQLTEIKGFSNLPAKARLIVASDVHIRASEEPRFHLLCALVRAAKDKGAATFVLNGDIFDFFFGWRNYFQRKYRPLFDSLKELAESGCEVWFVEGNHEFAMSGMDKKFGFKLVPSEGAIWRDASGRQVLIAHGDLLRHDPWYFAFRALVRSFPVNVLAALMPQKILDIGTAWFATTSRKKDKYRTLRHDKVIGSATSALMASGAQDIIIGHFHYPYSEDLGNGGRLLSVTSWDKPSCLVMTEEGSFMRVWG